MRMFREFIDLSLTDDACDFVLQKVRKTSRLEVTLARQILKQIFQFAIPRSITERYLPEVTFLNLADRLDRIVIETDPAKQAELLDGLNLEFGKLYHLANPPYFKHLTLKKAKYWMNNEWNARPRSKMRRGVVGRSGRPDNRHQLSVISSLLGAYAIIFDCAPTVDLDGEATAYVRSYFSEASRVFDSMPVSDQQERALAFWSEQMISSAGWQARLKRAFGTYPQAVQSLIMTHQAPAPTCCRLPRHIKTARAKLIRSLAKSKKTRWV